MVSGIKNVAVYKNKNKFARLDQSLLALMKTAENLAHSNFPTPQLKKLRMSE